LGSPLQLSIPHTARGGALYHMAAVYTDQPVEKFHLYVGGDMITPGHPLDMAGIEDGVRVQLHASEESTDIAGFLPIVQALASAQTAAACQAPRIDTPTPRTDSPALDALGSMEPSGRGVLHVNEMMMNPP